MAKQVMLPIPRKLQSINFVSLSTCMFDCQKFVLSFIPVLFPKELLLVSYAKCNMCEGLFLTIPIVNFKDVLALLY